MSRFTKNTFFKEGMAIQLLVLLSGCAALSWEVIWQLKTSLALGASAWGTALTLAVTMGGMSVGALVMGHALRNKTTTKPLRLYGILEFIVGICGLLLGTAFHIIEKIDTQIYSTAPESAPAIYLAGITVALGIPALCLGATLPVIGLAARQYRTSISLLYGLNTLGAAAGALLAAFLLIPLLGVTAASYTIAAVNIIVGSAALILGGDSFITSKESEETSAARPSLAMPVALLVVFVTGFATFALEVSWFRSLTSAFRSTTDAFAIMLACVLLSLGLAARFVPLLKKNKAPLGVLLAWAGILTLAMTPVIERFDLIAYQFTPTPFLMFTKWFFMTFYVIGAPVFLLGIALPWLLDEQHNPRKWGILYGFNALSAILGSLCAGWLLLPAIGFAKTAWLAGLLVAGTGLFLAPANKRIVLASLGVMALIVAVFLESGVGKTRVQSSALTGNLKLAKILRTYEGPDATISVVEAESGFKMLVINGFIATLQLDGLEGDLIPTHYMPWMGHMPMLLHPDPQKALVIAFGTGQTANAVRREKPQSLDIVDLNAKVFSMADLFTMNEGVLDDPIVHKTIMDGRAYIRRTNTIYDVITLEPMPPNFAGVNALYSKEFYEHARSKLGEDGVIAQWLPFHLVPAYYSASIARTFHSVFPNSILWIDPLSSTGILLGSKNDTIALGTELPGFLRTGVERDLSEEDVRKGILLSPDEMEKYVASGAIVTDDNQLLAYGRSVYLSHRNLSMTTENRKFIEKIIGKDMLQNLKKEIKPE